MNNTHVFHSFFIIHFGRRVVNAEIVIDVSMEVHISLKVLNSEVKRDFSV